MPFKKGQSGNPAGRKPGTRARPSILGTQLQALGFDPIATLVHFAKDEGHPADLRLRATAIITKYAFAAPNTAESTGLTTGTYAERANKLLALVTAGDITLPQAELLLNLLLGAGQTALLDEFRQRVETLKSS